MGMNQTIRGIDRAAQVAIVTGGGRDLRRAYARWFAGAGAAVGVVAETGAIGRHELYTLRLRTWGPARHP